VFEKLKEVMKFTGSETTKIEEIEKILGGLTRVCFPSGEILWLCDHHRKSRKM
jgi:hypothetical protein